MRPKFFIVSLCLLAAFSCDDEPVDAWEGAVYDLMTNGYYTTLGSGKKFRFSVGEYQLNTYVSRLVTSDIIFHCNGNPLPSNDFLPTEAGKYVIGATVSGVETNRIELIVFPEENYDPVSIPVIFHVLSDSPEKFTPSIAESLLAKTNQLFANTFYATNPNTNNVDTKISFRLAKYGYGGERLPIPGIHLLGQNTLTTELISETKWPMEDYLNVYVAWGSMMSAGTYPPRPHDDKICAPWYNEDFVTAYGLYYVTLINPTEYAHMILAHEFGHFLGLTHNFTNACIESVCLADIQFYNEDNFYFVGTQQSGYRNCSNGSRVIHDNIMDYRIAQYRGFSYEQRKMMRTVLSKSPIVNQLQYSTR